MPTAPPGGCICRIEHRLLALTFTGNPWWLLGAGVAGYGFAWFSHLRFEKNRPATFRHPLYSFMGDWLMSGRC